MLDAGEIRTRRFSALVNVALLLAIAFLLFVLLWPLGRLP
jgi:hypothetical protein